MEISYLRFTVIGVTLLCFVLWMASKLLKRSSLSGVVSWSSYVLAGVYLSCLLIDWLSEAGNWQIYQNGLGFYFILGFSLLSAMVWVKWQKSLQVAEPVILLMVTFIVGASLFSLPPLYQPWSRVSAWQGKDVAFIYLFWTGLFLIVLSALGWVKALWTKNRVEMRKSIQQLASSLPFWVLGLGVWSWIQYSERLRFIAWSSHEVQLILVGVFVLLAALYVQGAASLSRFKVFLLIGIPLSLSVHFLLSA